MEMVSDLRFVLTLVTALGCGLIAGLFFAFSVSVMKGLAHRPPAEGMAAMQAINVAILNVWFGGVFFGTALACIPLVILSLWDWQAPGAFYLLAGGVLYLAGSIGVTLVFNVPRNEALAAAAPAGPGSAALWRSYLTVWTAWNHVRTVASLAAMASLILALCY